MSLKNSWETIYRVDEAVSFSWKSYLSETTRTLGRS